MNKKSISAKAPKYTHNQGFTLIELLAAITILGILMTIAIVSVTQILDRARTEYYLSSIKELKLAGQSYYNDNRNKMPKITGRKAEITLKELQDAKYIGKITDYKKKECDVNKSYVRIFKYDRNDYSYSARLICDETTDEIPNIPKPKITIEQNVSSEKVKKANVEITIVPLDPAEDTTDYEDATLMSYNYIIYRDNKEIVSSGIINANYKKEIKRTVDLSEYTPGSIRVKVTATNSYGEVKTATSTKSYNDTIGPECGTIEGASTTWLTAKNSTRKISVQCIDNDGSGCKREKYTQTFSKDKKIGYITIEDNNNNKTKCPVNVYIDMQTPTLTLKAYKRTSSGGKTGNEIASVTVKDGAATGTMNSYSGTTGSWLNASAYPYGVYYEATMSDNLMLGHRQWVWNSANLTSSSSNVNNLTNDNSGSETLITGKNMSENFFLSAEGYRKGKYTIKDEAGNSVIVNITAPIDRTAPTNPEITNPTGGSWTNKDFALTVTSADAISGLKNFAYKYANTGWSTYGNSNHSPFITTNYSQERNELTYIRACDNAGNCSGSSSSYIRIDKTAPTTPTIDNPTGGKCTMGQIKLTDKTKENGSGVAYWQWRYGNTSWKTYENSASTTFVTTPYVAARNELTYQRACDNAGNCSPESSTTIHIGGCTTVTVIRSSYTVCPEDQEKPTRSQCIAYNYNKMFTNVSVSGTKVHVWGHLQNNQWAHTINGNDPNRTVCVARNHSCVINLKSFSIAGSGYASLGGSFASFDKTFDASNYDAGTYRIEIHSGGSDKWRMVSSSGQADLFKISH